MTAFWIIVAALCAAVLLALLRPLLKPQGEFSDDSAASNLRILRVQLAELDGELQAGRIDAEQHAVARSELERRVLEEGSGGTAEKPLAARGKKSRAAAPRTSRSAAWTLAVALPLVAMGLYATLGRPEALDPALASAADEASNTGEHAGPGDMEAAAARLAARLQTEPANADGWALLGRTYARLERFEQARDAYAKALEQGRAPDAQLLADYADVLAMTQGRRITPEAEALVMKALALDPNHLKSLALAGTAALARGDHAKAVQYWTRARDQAPPDSELARGISSGIAEARAAGGLPQESGAPATAGAKTAAGPTPRAANTQATPASAAATAGGLRVNVQIASELAAKIPPGATLFVFARAAEGPRMPLAILRLPATPLPGQVQLDDSTAMSPQMRLSAFSQVVVVARISASGGATPQPGDLEGESPPVANTGQVKLTINRLRP